ncbi:hypothetical protein CBW65_17735 [Tumebacillus avium]|uniref:Uncharacterized protein n=1 Tax=Tumebacillus avium TaxID=1903704 RepID=A0A1Y0ITB4_9BACL|nr:hypothetical protein CBW65_17735 [Tumebacillus avium]
MQQIPLPERPDPGGDPDGQHASADRLEVAGYGLPLAKQDCCRQQEQAAHREDEIKRPRVGQHERQADHADAQPPFARQQRKADQER